MLKLNCYVLIEGEQKWEISAVHNISIVEDTEMLTDFCEIQLPKKMQWKTASQNGFPPIKRGDKISVKLGYDNELITRFVGYVQGVDNQSPMTIKCENSMYLLKIGKAQPKSWKKANLKQVLQHLLKDTDIDFEFIDQDIPLGSYRITQSTICEELQQIKEKYMLDCYFKQRDDRSVLLVGFKYRADKQKKHIFRYGKNIISHELEFLTQTDIPARIQAQSFDLKQRKISVELGDNDGDLIQVRIDGLTQDELKEYAQSILNNYKKNGIKGSFETFGSPVVNKADAVEIHTLEGNKGIFCVKSNKINFGINGYRQKIELVPSI